MEKGGLSRDAAVLLQVYVGLGWALGCALIGLLIVKQPAECRIGRQYLCQVRALCRPPIESSLSRPRCSISLFFKFRFPWPFPFAADRWFPIFGGSLPPNEQDQPPIESSLSRPRCSISLFFKFRFPWPFPFAADRWFPIFGGSLPPKEQDQPPIESLAPLSRPRCSFPFGFLDRQN